MADITIEVNQTPITCKQGERLIDVLKAHNIFIAHFCYHEALGADGNCRMCMVEIAGQKRPQIACDTFVQEGMVVHTKNSSIDHVKRSILELELINHPVDCPICDQAGECSLQTYYMEFGLYESHLNVEKNHKQKHVDLGRGVVLDQERCVLCARCTRFTQNITKSGELSIVGRGDYARVSTAPGQKMQTPYALNVVDLCPVGALTSKDFRFKQRVWFLQSKESICHHCAKGCTITIDYNQLKYEKERIYRFRPRPSAINSHFLCDDGRLSYKEQNSPLLQQITHHNHVITQPEFERHGAELLAKESNKIALTCSASLSLEQLYALKLFTRNSGIDFSVYSHLDDSFADDWLKSRYRSANIAGATLLNLPIQNRIDSDLAMHYFIFVITTERALIDEAAKLIRAGYQVIVFSPFYYEALSDAYLMIPFASFTHDSGTLINCDNILQPFACISEQGTTLLQLLHALDSQIPQDNRLIQQHLKTHMRIFETVDFSRTTTLEGVPCLS